MSPSRASRGIALPGVQPCSAERAHSRLVVRSGAGAALTADFPLLVPVPGPGPDARDRSRSFSDAGEPERRPLVLADLLQVAVERLQLALDIGFRCSRRTRERERRLVVVLDDHLVGGVHFGRGVRLGYSRASLVSTHDGRVRRTAGAVIEIPTAAATVRRVTKRQQRRRFVFDDLGGADIPDDLRYDRDEADEYWRAAWGQEPQADTAVRLVVEGGEDDAAECWVEIEFDRDWVAVYPLVFDKGRWLPDEPRFRPARDGVSGQPTARQRQRASIERERPRIARLLEEAVDHREALTFGLVPQFDRNKEEIVDALRRTRDPVERASLRKELENLERDQNRLLADDWRVVISDQWEVTAPRSRRGRKPEVDPAEIERLQKEEGLSYKGIADRLGKHPKTFGNVVHKARKRKI
jgi:hypothetical protein